MHRKRVIVAIAALVGRATALAQARVSAKGLTRGTRVGWCEDDCRALRTAEGSIPVVRALPTAP